MALTATSITLALNYVTLTEPVKRIMNSLPKVLPAELYTRTAKVIGNKYRRFVFRPSRASARRTPYGAPPKSVAQTGAGSEDIVMISSSELIDAGTEVLELFMEYANYTVQNMAEMELDRRASDFAVRQQNLRTNCIHSAVAFGKIFFDSEGELSLTDVSASGGYTYDYKVPSGNRAAAGVNFADPSANIVNWIVGMQQQYLFDTGFKSAIVVCGKNVSSYLANNVQFQTFLRYNRALSDQYIQSGIMPQNADVLGWKWIFAHEAYFVKDDGTVAGVFDPDQITILPDLTPQMYDLKEGSVPVPKNFMTLAQDGDFNTLVRDLLSNQVHGAVRFAYGTALPFPQINMVQADNFYPDFKNPNTMYFIDSTP